MKGALAGIRVADLTHALAGPFCTRILSDLGAEIIKVEPPTGDDYRKSNPPWFYGEDSANFWGINRNKKSIVLDLKVPKARKIFYELVKKSDVVVDNFRPGVTERLKVDYRTLKRYNPKLVCCSVSAYGYTSPYRDQPGYDGIAQAMSGSMSIMGKRGAPVITPVAFGDLMGGALAAHAILAAYISAQKTGKGQSIDLALLDGQIYLISTIAQRYFNSGILPKAWGDEHESSVIYQCFKTKDVPVMICAHHDDFFERFCRVIGRPDLSKDSRFTTWKARLKNRRTLVPIVKRIVRDMSGRKLLQKLEKAKVAAAPIFTVDQALDNPHIAAREMVVELEGTSGPKVKTVGNPLKLSSTFVKSYRRPPLLGEDTREVLKKVLGYTDKKIDSLAKTGVVKVR